MTVGHRLLAHLNPDGNLTEAADRARRRGLNLGRQEVDLMSGISGNLTPGCRAELDALFAKLAAPGADTEHAADPHRDVSDPRSQAQRNHDALEKLCDRVLGDPALGTHRGVPVTAIITMRLADLERCAGRAPPPAAESSQIRDALAMAEHSHPILVLFDHHGRPLHLGRKRRLASADQRLALIAADGGCSKPKCTVPADQCQIHHADDDWHHQRQQTHPCLRLPPHRRAPGPLGWQTKWAVTPTTPAAAPGPPRPPCNNHPASTTTTTPTNSCTATRATPATTSRRDAAP